MDDNEYFNLDDGIQEGLCRMSNAESAEDFALNAKAVKDLYETKNEEKKIEEDSYLKELEVDMNSQLKNRINPNTVMTCGTGIFLTLATMFYESDGHLFRVSDIGRLMIGLFTKRD